MYMPTDSNYMLFIDTARQAVGLVGVAVIILGVAYAALHFVVMFLRLNKKGGYEVDHIRLRLGHTIILGLEFIVAADIIGSVIHPDYYKLGILAGLVAIRAMLTFLLNQKVKIAKFHK